MRRPAPPHRRCGCCRGCAGGRRGAVAAACAAGCPKSDRLRPGEPHRLAGSGTSDGLMALLRRGAPVENKSFTGRTPRTDDVVNRQRRQTLPSGIPSASALRQPSPTPFWAYCDRAPDRHPRVKAGSGETLGFATPSPKVPCNLWCVASGERQAQGSRPLALLSRPPSADAHVARRTPHRRLQGTHPEPPLIRGGLRQTPCETGGSRSWTRSRG